MNSLWEANAGVNVDLHQLFKVSTYFDKTE